MPAPSFASGVPRLVAVDLDGTLLTTDKRLSERTRRAVAGLDRCGVAVVLCTGRPPRSSRPYAAQLGLAHPFVCYNGAAIYDPGRDRATIRARLSSEVARAALQRLRAAFPDLMVGVESENGWYLEPAMLTRRVREARFGPEDPTAVGPAESFLEGGVIKLLVRAGSAEAPVPASAMAPAVGGLPLQATWSATSLLELLAPSVDKQAALAELVEALGIDRHDVAAFGDQRNDVEMLRWAGLGVAVANASAEVRSAADAVTLSNDEDGVAAVLEGWLHEPMGEVAHPPPTGER